MGLQDGCRSTRLPMRSEARFCIVAKRSRACQCCRAAESGAPSAASGCSTSRSHGMATDPSQPSSLLSCRLSKLLAQRAVSICRSWACSVAESDGSTSGSQRSAHSCAQKARICRRSSGTAGAPSASSSSWMLSASPSASASPSCHAHAAERSARVVSRKARSQQLVIHVAKACVSGAAPCSSAPSTVSSSAAAGDSLGPPASSTGSTTIIGEPPPLPPLLPPPPPLLAKSPLLQLHALVAREPRAFSPPDCGRQLLRSSRRTRRSCALM